MIDGPTATDGPELTDGPDEPVKSEQRKFPTAFTVLAIVLLAVWALSFVIPSGSYELDEKTGGPVPGSYEQLPECDEVEKGTHCVNKSLPEQLQQLWTSVPNGLYGIENGRGNVDPFNSGFLYGSAMIFLFVLAVGGFVSVTMRTEAIQTGIGRLALRYKHSVASASSASTSPSGNVAFGLDATRASGKETLVERHLKTVDDVGSRDFRFGMTGILLIILIAVVLAIVS